MVIKVYYQHEIAPITNVTEAKVAWDLFFGRFFSPEIPEGVDVAFDSNIRSFSPREDKTLRTKHSDDFEDFLNEQTIDIPDDIIITQEDLDSLYDDLDNGIYKHSLKHVYCALWLFKQNRMTRQQMATILSRAQIPEEYPIVAEFELFDQNGAFSNDALNILIPAIRRAWFGVTKQPFSDEKLTRFVCLLNTMPKSEKIFFLSKTSLNIKTGYRDILCAVLYRLHSWHIAEYDGEIYDVHLSFGIIEAMQIAEVGFMAAAANRVYLGILDINTIKQGVEQNFRPTAISIPKSNVKSPSEKVHDWEETPLPVVTQHDVFHAKTHNTIAHEFHLLFNHLHQAIFNHTKRIWSKTTWAFVDREFLMFAQEKLLLKSPAEGAKLFSLFWEYYEKRALYLFRDYSDEFLNDDGFAIIWDMVNYPDVWKKLFLIDPDYLGEPYLGHFNQIKQFKNHVNPDDSPSIISLKYRFYRMYRDTKDFTKICALIDELKDELTAGLKFKSEVQTNLLNGLGIRNITTLYLNNKPVHEMNLHQILPQLVEMKLEKQWGKKVSQTLPEELTNQFKSIPQGSTFSKAFLEKSLKEIHSKHDQLDFLEKCYGNIVKSEQYVRRNQRLDEMFSFFRNDLTTSQRVHIQILKEKYQAPLPQ
jgi:hypothetical protein